MDTIGSDQMAAGIYESPRPRRSIEALQAQASCRGDGVTRLRFDCRDDAGCADWKCESGVGVDGRRKSRDGTGETTVDAGDCSGRGRRGQCVYQHEEEKEADVGEACLPGALLRGSGQTIMPVIDCTKATAMASEAD